MSYQLYNNMFGLFIFPARHLTMPQRCCNRLTSPCCNKNIIKLLSSLSILFMLSVFLFVSLLISGFIGGYIKTISSFYFKPSCGLLYLLGMWKDSFKRFSTFYLCFSDCESHKRRGTSTSDFLLALPSSSNPLLSSGALRAIICSSFSSGL